ncbi:MULTISPECIES: hypothetical protein [Arcobacteraceae]|nr:MULTISPECIES: hypothetical protein [Arcobacteraceae]
MAIGEYTNIGGNAGNYIPITIVNENRGQVMNFHFSNKNTFF